MAEIYNTDGNLHLVVLTINMFNTYLLLQIKFGYQEKYVSNQKRREGMSLKIC